MIWGWGTVVSVLYVRWFPVDDRTCSTLTIAHHRSQYTHILTAVYTIDNITRFYRFLLWLNEFTTYLRCERERDHELIGEHQGNHCGCREWFEQRPTTAITITLIVTYLIDIFYQYINILNALIEKNTMNQSVYQKIGTMSTCAWLC